MSTDGAGHGGHGGTGSDIGHSTGLDNADLGVGHGQGHQGSGHGHHGGHDFNGKVTVEALMVAHAFCGVPGFGNFGHANFSSSVDAHSGMPDHGHVGSWSTGDGVDKNFLKSNEALIRAVEKAKNDPLRRTYGVHVVGHGYCDSRQIFCRLATELGAIRVCGTTGNFNPTDVSLDDITDWSKFAPPYLRKRTPAGWYPKALGTTHIWRQYWQVGPKRHWWRRPKGRPVYDRSQLTYLEVQIVTWYFAAIGDYETRIDLRVVSAPILDQADKRWAIKGIPLKKHQILSQKLTDGLFMSLKQAVPSNQAKIRRAKLIELQTTKPAEVESSGADLNALFATYKDPSQTQGHPAAPATSSTVAPTASPAAGPAVQPAPASAAAPTPAAKAAVVPPPPQPAGKDVEVHVKIPAPVLRNKH